MWTFTEKGFFSINRTPDGTKLQFRSRRKQDLENLRKDYPTEFKDETVQTFPHADYRWRLEATPASAAIVMCALTERIQYRNFKNHLEDTDQSDKLNILHRIWHLMNEYQSDQIRPPQKPAERECTCPAFAASMDCAVHGINGTTIPRRKDYAEDLPGFYDAIDEEPDQQEPETAASIMRTTVLDWQFEGKPITIRELAKILGLTNGKTIDLCEAERMKLNESTYTDGIRHRHAPPDWTVEEE